MNNQLKKASHGTRTANFKRPKAKTILNIACVSRVTQSILNMINVWFFYIVTSWLIDWLIFINACSRKLNGHQNNYQIYHMVFFFFFYQ